MNNFAYYVYINNCVYSLDLLSEIVTKLLDFWINVHTGYHFFHETFNSKPELLRCLNDMNQATANSYTKTFLIDPPYYVKQSWQPVTNILLTRITTYNMTCTFISAGGGPTGCENGTEFEKFLFMNREKRFDIYYLTRIHKFLIKSKIVRPVVNNGRALPRTLDDILFSVALGTGDITTARIDKFGGFFLNLKGCTNDQIFKTYGIEKASLQRFLTKPMVTTQYWPEDTLDSLASTTSTTTSTLFAVRKQHCQFLVMKLCFSELLFSFHN